MKISFSNWGLDVSSINGRVTWCVILLSCLFAGSYVLGRYFGLLVVLLLAIAGIVIARAGSARLSSNNSDEVETAPVWKDGPQVTAGWDYRPKSAIRRLVDVDLAAETAEDPSSHRLVANENVWYNALDCAAVAPEPIVEAPLSDCANTASTYDQGPIDNNGVAAK
jgi:hypothetical protein